MKKATREQTKAHNKRLILNKIYNSVEVSRAEVARLTGLTRSTVSDIVAELIEEGLVSEIGQGKSVGGKPPILLSVENGSQHIIGLDLASGEFRGAIINLRGEIKHRLNLPINDVNGEVALSLVYQLIDHLLDKATSPILGIGIGTPGLMDAENGIVLNAVNLDWKDLPLGDLLKDRYHLPIYIANDSQVSAMAEYSFGEHKGERNLVLFKVGRGIGAGIVLNQQIHHGDGFGAGEIGHVEMEENGELCLCGHYGCLETKASSRAIRKMAMRIAQKNKDSVLNRLVSNPEEITTEIVLIAFEEKDPDVINILNEVGTYLGKAAAFLASIVNIHRIVVAGFVSEFGDGIIKPMKEQLQKGALQAIAQNTEITTSFLGTDIVVLGAAAIVLQNELGIL